MIRIAVLQDPHSHSEHDILLAIERAGMQAHAFLWHEYKENLADFDGFVLIGCDSQEASTHIGAAAPVMQLIKEQSALGKPVLGICKGAELLVETGLVPGLERNQVGMVLADNTRMQHNELLGTGFYNAKVRLRLSEGYQWNAFTRHLTPKTIFQMAVSHAKGRFIIPPVLLAEIERNGLHVFQYCDERGAIINEFPVNPNGSIHNIAAIANKPGNIMAMLPHPESISQGDAIFKSMCEYITGGYMAQPITLDYQPR